MNSLLLITTTVSPFLAAYLTYYFSVKGKRKEIGIEREKHLNTVLSNLLIVWYDLIKLKSLLLVITDDRDDSIFPKKFYSIQMLNSGLNDNILFDDLENAIKLLKQYDAITYFKLQGVGHNLMKIRQDYIMPYIETPDLDSNLVKIGAGTLLDDCIKDYHQYILNISHEIGNKMKNKANDIVNAKSNFDKEDIINELNINYYQFILNIIPEGEEKPSYDEFLKFSKSEDYIKMLEIQLEIIKKGNMSEFLTLISENPNISPDDILLKQNQSKSS